jgi:uncharacterized membrane protein YecN with MAPEG domain
MQFLPTVTILYAGIFGLLLLVISLNIFREYVNMAAGNAPNDSERWKRSERAQQSFIEYVPITLLLFFLIEAHGAPSIILHGLGITLLAARVFHAYGVGRGNVADFMRLIGTQTTYLVLMVCSLACVYYALLPMLVH